MPHICIWVSIGSDNGLSSARHQAITWTNAHILSIGPLGTNFREICIKIKNFLFKEMHLKTLSAKCQPFCPGRDELINAKLCHGLLLVSLWCVEYNVISYILSYLFSCMVITLPCMLTHLPLEKWLPFSRQYFQMHFREWKVLYFD